MAINLAAANEILKDAVQVRENAERIVNIFCDGRLRLDEPLTEPVLSLKCVKSLDPDPSFSFETPIGTVVARFGFKPVVGSGYSTTGLKGQLYFYKKAPAGMKDILIQYGFNFDDGEAIHADPDLSADIDLLEENVGKARLFRRSVLGEVVYRLAGMVEAGFQRADS
ncbi:hypothetical protein [Herbaspirillum huttiense]|uniref:hypothetical protein n=1 Tax=Herbaspirillum huttiense TaxID=863372 RepID=UPI0031D56A99